VAVAYDAVASITRTLIDNPMIWTHTPVGTPRAVVAAFVHGTSSTDHVLTVTYGGVAMTEIVRATDTVTEPGAAELWFLGAGIPTGAQTISAALSIATTDDIHGISFSLTALTNTEVVSSGSINEDAANPTITLAKNGRVAWGTAAMYGGAAAPGGTLATGNTLGPTSDLGAFYSQTCRETTPDATNRAIGWSTLAADDLAFVALNVSEIVAVTSIPDILKAPRLPGGRDVGRL